MKQSPSTGRKSIIVDEVVLSLHKSTSEEAVMSSLGEEVSVFRVEDYLRTVPTAWEKKNSVFVPVLPRDSLALSLATSSTSSKSVIVAGQLFQAQNAPQTVLLSTAALQHGSLSYSTVPVTVTSLNARNCASPSSVASTPDRSPSPGEVLGSANTILSSTVGQSSKHEEDADSKGAMYLIEGFSKNLDEKVIGGRDNSKHFVPKHVLELNPKNLPHHCDSIEALTVQVSIYATKKSSATSTKKAAQAKKNTKKKAKGFVSKSQNPDELFLESHKTRQFTLTPDQRWIATFDDMLIHYSSHLHGNIFLRFELYSQTDKENPIATIDTVSFETISIRGLSKRKQKKREREATSQYGDEDDDDDEEEDSLVPKKKKKRTSRSSSPSSSFACSVPSVPSSLSSTPASSAPTTPLQALFTPPSTTTPPRSTTTTVTVYMITNELFMQITGMSLVTKQISSDYFDVKHEPSYDSKFFCNYGTDHQNLYQSHITEMIQVAGGVRGNNSHLQVNNSSYSSLIESYVQQMDMKINCQPVAHRQVQQQTQFQYVQQPQCYSSMQSCFQQPAMSFKSDYDSMLMLDDPIDCISDMSQYYSLLLDQSPSTNYLFDL